MQHKIHCCGALWARQLNLGKDPRDVQNSSENPDKPVRFDQQDGIGGKVRYKSIGGKRLPETKAMSCSGCPVGIEESKSSPLLSRLKKNLLFNFVLPLRTGIVDRTGWYSS